MALRELEEGIRQLQLRIGEQQLLITEQQALIAELQTDAGTLESGVNAAAAQIALINARTRASTRYTASGVLTTAWVTYVTVVVSCENRPIAVHISATYSNGNSGANRKVDFRLQMDGVTVGEELTDLMSLFVSGSSSLANIADTFTPTPTAGSRTFTLQAKASANSAVILTRASIAVVE